MLWKESEPIADKKWLTDFQTPPFVCKYMVSLIPNDVKTVLEPTPGVGNLVRELKSKYEVTAPEDYFKLDPQRFDCVVMNPPFSHKYAFNVPPHWNKAGMRLGYHILTECMNVSENIIALMPWFTLSDSDVRLRALKRYGLVSITALPRSTFQYARIQTVVLFLKRNHQQETIFKVLDTINDNQLLLL